VVDIGTFTKRIMEKLDIPMPETGMAVDVEEAVENADRIG